MSRRFFRETVLRIPRTIPYRSVVTAPPPPPPPPPPAESAERRRLLKWHRLGVVADPAEGNYTTPCNEAHSRCIGNLQPGWHCDRFRKSNSENERRVVFFSPFPGKRARGEWRAASGRVMHPLIKPVSGRGAAELFFLTSLASAIGSGRRSSRTVPPV